MSHNNKKISELPDATLPITTGVKFEAVQGGINVKVDADDMPGSGGGGAVDSVNGQTGVVVLDAGDVGADPAGTAAALLTGTISDSDTTHAPTGNAVFDALALKQNILNAATALTDAATIDLTAIKHTLTTASSRTFTISYTGDDITIEVTLSAATATQTFPVAALCVSEGVVTGDNTCPMSGLSGDKYIITIKKVGSAYYVVCKNFGQ